MRNIRLMAAALAVGYTLAQADTVRVIVNASGLKYNGTVTAMIQPTATTPAKLYFTQTASLPIGGTGCGLARDTVFIGDFEPTSCDSPPFSLPWTLMWTKMDGTVVTLSCDGTIPSYDGLLHYQLWCEAQP